MKALNIVLLLILYLALTSNALKAEPETLLEKVAVNALTAFRQYQDQARDGHSLFGFERELGGIWQNNMTCKACRTTMGGLDGFLSHPITYKSMEVVITFYCTKYMKIQEEVCAGAITAMGDVLIPQLTKFMMTPDYSCSRLFGFCNSPKWYTLSSEDYIRRMIADKPEAIRNNDYIDNIYQQIKNDPNPRETLRVLHMSDIHMSTEYQEGNNKNCGEPLCCMRDNGPAPTPADAAHKFGEYNCDAPPVMIETFFEFVKNLEDQPDFVLWTGDNIAHDIWNQTNEKNAKATGQIVDFMKEHWPELPIFLSTGNHEFFPVNVENFDPTKQPVLSLIAEHLTDYLDQDAIETFKKYGYCSVPLKTRTGGVMDNVRVITLNTQAFNDMNWGLLTTLTDPGDQITWLEAQFRDMEAKGQFAILLGHIPPTSMYDWSIRYKALVERFQHVIRFQAFGHFHSEEFTIVRGAYDFKPIASYHAAGSITPYSDLNPSFRVMEFDKETMLPLKMHSYFLNLTRAQQENVATWEYAYEFTNVYEMDDMSPSGLYKFTEKMFDKPELVIRYLKNHNQNGPGSENVGCDTNCLFSMKCSFTSANGYLEDDCNERPRHNVWQDILTQNYPPYLFEPWISGPSP